MHVPIFIALTIMSIATGFIFTQEVPMADQQTEQSIAEEKEPDFTENTLVQEENQKEDSFEPASAKESSAPITEGPEEQTAPTPLLDQDSDETPQETVEPMTSEVTTEASIVKALEDIPEPVKDEVLTIPENSPEEEKPTGIDTVSLENPQGNWLFKKIWWERAEERYEKIRLLVDTAWESRTSFFVKRNDLDRNVLDPFYLTVGIGQGELQTILSEMIDFFEKHREEQGDLNEQERRLYETIAPQEEALTQLKVDIEAIANLDHSIDDALGTLMNQINRVRQFERQAWENFKEIAHILNDTKARELYYMIEGAARNIKNVNSYIEQEFLTHFNRLISEATKHVTRVQNQIDVLKEQGINFKRQTELLEQNSEQAEQEEDSDMDTDRDVTQKPKPGWINWIISSLSNAVNMIISIARIPYDMIFGK